VDPFFSSRARGSTVREVTLSRVLAVPPAAPAVAAAFFAAQLACRTDVADVAAALASGDPGFVLLDSRGDAAWAQARILGARHLPTASIAEADLDPAVPVVTYCWGPGCDGATRAALALARRGLRVKEMIGGFEYWVREGLPVETDAGVTTAAVDPLTAPTCDC
jgi:rhodanese-related sulfurtransferase